MLKSVGCFFIIALKLYAFMVFPFYFRTQMYFFDEKLVELVSSFKLYDLQAKP